MKVTYSSCASDSASLSRMRKYPQPNRRGMEDLSAGTSLVQAQTFVYHKARKRALNLSVDALM